LYFFFFSQIKKMTFTRKKKKRRKETQTGSKEVLGPARARIPLDKSAYCAL
tara:strand:- start:192 stop:344 length:153 start_codon:yes stop_codon:yes gene_type:complete